MEEIWLCFRFDDVEFRYNMSSKHVASVCDDLASDLDFLYWKDHMTGEWRPVSIWTVVERFAAPETDEECKL